jgi:hypothetical protein
MMAQAALMAIVLAGWAAHSRRLQAHRSKGPCGHGTVVRGTRHWRLTAARTGNVQNLRPSGPSGNGPDTGVLWLVWLLRHHAMGLDHGFHHVATHHDVTDAGHGNAIDVAP